MASTDPLDELLCILNERISFDEKANKIASVKSLCEKVVVEESLRNVSDDRKVLVCDFSHLQFPRSEQQRCLNHLPVRTTGDGNCLYNACSIALCGNESLASYLRCLTSIELFLNSSFYAKHPIIEQQHKKGAFSSIANTFAMCLSDIALGSVTKEDPCAPILTEAYSNAMNHQWSSFICLLSLSSVVKRPIESYFPITPNEEKIDSLSTMFNCTIYPREIATSISDQKIIYFVVH
ncbi:uncharacterized protein LOC114544742 [Dendronephthya gigantea]|uniref:uncharacterized protein LOC114544742 n=1 Tax=Dendronephthya gigantea TaxID=151771 RepID=UPI00106A22FE|nr:uncharacterized protein LOC114544742 [Dendronephthya gigantea]